VTINNFLIVLPFICKIYFMPTLISA